MAGRVDEVDEEARAILALLNAVQVVLRDRAITDRKANIQNMSVISMWTTASPR